MKGLAKSDGLVIVLLLTVIGVGELRLELFKDIIFFIPFHTFFRFFRRGYSISKRLVKPTRFKSFPLQLSGHQDIPLLSFVRVASSTLIRCGWVFISARSVENCISVERLNTLSIDLQSLLQNIKKIAEPAATNKVYSH